MTKLGKAAVKAAAVVCLTGSFFLANPYGTVVKEQQDYVMSVAKSGNILELGLLEAASKDEVNLDGNHEVAGLAAVMSGDLDLDKTEAQDTAETESGKAADSSEETSESKDKAAQETKADAQETKADAQETEADAQETEAAKEEKVILTAKVENSLNIRKKPDEESDVVGKLFRGCTAEVIKEKGNWYKISSNDVTGWVSKDYVLTGKASEKFLKKVDPSVATVTANSLNLRAKASTDSDVVSVLKKGSEFMVISEGKEWVQIRYTTNLEGYVSAEYVKVKEKAGEAVSIKTLEKYVELAEEKEAERRAAEEAAAEAARKAAEAEAEAKASRQSSGSSSDSSSSKSSSGSSSGSSYSAGSDDVTLLAALCQYEAGTNYDNCLAVANVVLNRVRSSSYPNSIRGVIYQSGQFGTVTSGALDRFLSSGPASTCVSAAKAALAGNNNIGSRVQFRAVWATDPSSHSNSVVIGDNCFF